MEGMLVSVHCASQFEGCTKGVLTASCVVAVAETDAVMLADVARSTKSYELA